MSLLSEIINITEHMNLPCETGVFSHKAPDDYVVVTPMNNNLDLHCDNLPATEIQEARISLFSKHNFGSLRYKLSYALIKNDITITNSLYIGHEADTGYHHYAIDVAKQYEFELEE